MTSTLRSILSGALVALAASGLRPVVASAFGDRRAYDSLVALVRKGDTSVDLRMLRLTYSDLPDFDPSAPKGRAAEIAQALGDRAWDRVVEIADSVLEDEYLSLPAHRALAIAYQELGRTDSAAFHDDLHRRLVRSIVRIGNGSSPETAWSVISPEEERALIDAAGFEFQGQSLVEVYGHQYDRVEVNDPRTDEIRVLYFNVDIPWIRMRSLFSK
jgi:hypothetical protein